MPKINLEKTKAYVSYQRLTEAIKDKSLQDLMEDHDTELLSLITAHTLFVYAIKHCHQLIEDNFIEKGQTVVFQHQIEALSDIIEKIQVLNNYYFKPKDDESISKSSMD